MKIVSLTNLNGYFSPAAFLLLLFLFSYCGQPGADQVSTSQHILQKTIPAKATSKKNIPQKNSPELPPDDLASSAVVELKALLAPMVSITANFNQQLYSPDNYLIQTSNGQMHVATPGKMRWIIDKPVEQWLISNGSLLWIYDPDLEQVIIKSADPNIAATPMLLLSGSVSELSTVYQVSASDSDQYRSFKLVPRDRTTLYESLIFRFDKNTPVGIVIFDALGQRTEIVFGDVVQNAEIDGQLFSFRPPAGTDVIRDEN
jgi:outer membrane lipoprotein carrier protein